MPIGEVYPGLEQLIVDEALAEVAPGAIGELCVAGAQTSPGYWNECRAAPPQRFFERDCSRTADGNGSTAPAISWPAAPERLVYLGRRDTQVKVGGHRIELGEIEGVLRRGGCVEAVALAWPDEKQPDYIVAIVSGARTSRGTRRRRPQSLPELHGAARHPCDRRHAAQCQRQDRPQGPARLARRT